MTVNKEKISLADRISSLQRASLLQSWASQSNYNPLTVSRTEGCWIYTEDGRKIFDLRSAHECINIGYNHPEVIQAMQEQMKSVIYVTDDFATRPTAELASKLDSLTPGPAGKKIWFGQSGASAVEAALKTARFYQYNKMIEKAKNHSLDDRSYPYPYKIISRYRSWHGATSGALSVSGDPRRWFSEPITNPGVIFAPDAYPYRSPLGEDEDGLRAAEYMRYIIEMEGGHGYVAAVILETVVGSNGIIPAPKPYIKKIRQLCDEYGILLIVDETMTGIGRTGTLLAIEQYDVEPDIVIMGKALGVYCPLAACVVSARVASTFNDNIFGHGQSYAGHALACAAALATLKVIEKENILSHTVDMGKYLEDRLNALKLKHPSVGEVRGRGLMWTLELVKNRQTKEPIRSAGQKYLDNPVKKMAEFLLNKKNIYIPSDKFGIWITPPLIVTKEEIEYITDGIDEALKIADKVVV